MSGQGDAHNAGDCWAPTCPICADEDAMEWRCEAHGVVMAFGDCPECDDEMEALADELVSSPGQVDPS